MTSRVSQIRITDKRREKKGSWKRYKHGKKRGGKLSQTNMKRVRTITKGKKTRRKLGRFTRGRFLIEIEDKKRL